MAARFHGQRKLIDTETGEILHTQVVTKSSGDSGFHKIWLAEILDLMEEVGNAKIKVLMWLLSEADSQNQILATYKEIAEGSGVGIATVTRLMRALRKADVVTESRRSLWRLNPKVIFKGNHEQRLNVLIRFRSESQRDLFDDPTDQDDPADCILPDDYVVEPYEGHVTTANARELFGWRPGSGESVGEAAQRQAQQGCGSNP